MKGLVAAAVVALSLLLSATHGASAQQLTPRGGLVVNVTVSINTAPHSTLVALPGIGDVLATRIMEYRGSQPFSSCAQLEDVRGIGPKTAAKVCPLVDFSR